MNNKRAIKCELIIINIFSKCVGMYNIGNITIRSL